MPHEELYNTIFPGNAENNNPKELLQKVANEYPYFSLPHFFLLKETVATDFNYRKIAAKTALHFNNPFLLRYQLLSKVKVEVGEVPGVSEIPEVEKIDIVEDVQEFAQDVEVLEVPEVPGVSNVDMGEKVDEVKNVQEFSQDVEVPEISEVSNVANVDMGEKVEVVEEVREVQKVQEVQQMEQVVEVVENVELADKKEELLFEPLHTSDYFASQGIKLSEEAQTADKLGKQLKSFTDWLKTMKKKGGGKLPETNANIDLAVQNLAEKSNKEQEVLTEAMADVFIQQGKMEKAHDIYKKLSLLNPAKSAYFAAKIELLKEK